MYIRSFFYVIILVLVMNSTSLAQLSISVSGISHGIPAPYSRDVIIQLFNWPFSRVKNELPKLRSSGYRYILVSPPQLGIDNGKWWGRYQPKDFWVIESSLGNRAEFVDMLETASKLNLTVMVDAVINHTAQKTVECSPDGKTITKVTVPGFGPEDFHPCGVATDDKNSWLFGVLPDLATDRTKTQEKLTAYLSRLVELGVGAFRIDAAVHIRPRDLQKIIKGVEASGELYFIAEIARDKYEAFNHYLDLCPNLDFFDFPYLAAIGGIWSFEGDLRHLRKASSSAVLPDDRSVVFVRNHDFDRGQVNPKEGLNDSSYHMIDEAYLPLAYTYILASERGIPFVFADMIQPSPQIDEIPFETPFRPWLVAAIRFHNLCIASEKLRFEESNILEAKDLLVLRRGKSRFAVINKKPEAVGIRNLKTHVDPGKYQDIRTGDTIELGIDGLIQNYVIPPMTARLMVKVD